jgi:hypothetical protein
MRCCANALRFFVAVLFSFMGSVLLIALVAGLVAPKPSPPPHANRWQRCCHKLVASPRASFGALAAIARCVWDHPWSVRIRSVSTAITLSVKVRLLLSFAQVFAQISDAYRIRTPDAHGYRSLTQAIFSPLRLELFGWIPGLHTSCLGIESLQGKLLIYTLLPLGIVVMTLGLSWARTRSLVPALPVVLRVTYFFYPSVASKGFQTLAQCDCFEQINATALYFLPADYSVECDGELAPSYLLASGKLAVVLSGVGVPLLYAGLLFSCRDAIRTGGKTPLSEALNFLHGSLKPWALCAGP